MRHASNEEENIIVKNSEEFAILIVEYCEKLEAEKKFIVARQVLKSGTSIGANIHEAQNAESVADFIHKLKIAAKEVDETYYWLKICSKVKSYPFPFQLESRLIVIDKILTKIISSTKKRYAEKLGIKIKSH